MPATATPGAIPPALQAFARSAVERLVATPAALERALGEWLSEPKPQVWFARDGAAARTAGEAARCAVRLDRRTRMLYDERHVYLNGESYRASGRDARLMRRLADERRLDAADRRRLSAPARAQLAQWLADGWLQRAGSETDEA
jgi:50S ribosomal protein L16 3-hydroxylase